VEVFPAILSLSFTAAAASPGDEVVRQGDYKLLGVDSDDTVRTARCGDVRCL